MLVRRRYRCVQDGPAPAGRGACTARTTSSRRRRRGSRRTAGIVELYARKVRVGSPFAEDDLVGTLTGALEVSDTTNTICMELTIVPPHISAARRSATPRGDSQLAGSRRASRAFTRDARSVMPRERAVWSAAVSS
jgi:hypothetical protein